MDFAISRRGCVVHMMQDITQPWWAGYYIAMVAMSHEAYTRVLLWLSDLPCIAHATLRPSPQINSQLDRSWLVLVLRWLWGTLLAFFYFRMLRSSHNRRR